MVRDSAPSVCVSKFTQLILKNVQVVQVLLQTPMIVDGLRRCSDSPENQRARPGRQLITFLIASNLVMYVWDTFELKSYELQVSFGTVIFT